MVNLAALLSALLLCALALLLLAWLSQQITIYLQVLIYRLTRSEELAYVVYFLIFLPGVVVHEGAHWGMAKLLGLKTGKFRVWPKRQRKHLLLGSVSVQPGGPWRDSLVGMAPLLVGSLIVGAIAGAVFDAQGIARSLVRGEWRLLGTGLRAILTQPDGALWLYLIFTVANAMLPSEPDREPVKPVLLYIGGGALLYILIGLPLTALNAALNGLVGPLESLFGALLFVLLVDALVALILFGVDWAVGSVVPLEQ